MFNFDEIVNRRGTNSMKWDMFNDPAHVIPMPVADMDFKIAPVIQQKLQEIVSHAVFGYSICPSELPKIIVDDCLNKYNWAIKPEWLVFMPGMEVGITNVVKMWEHESKDILTVKPIYHPFYKAISYANKPLNTTDLVLENGRYCLNFEEIEQSFAQNTGLFMLCNPQNPGGTVFTKDELTRLANLCSKYNVTIMSDEIHCELLIDKSAKHIPIASLNHEILQNSITMISPSKTYNIAGIGCSVAIIPNEALRAKFEQTKAGVWPMVSRIGFEAALTAYTQGEPWRNELLDYLRANHNYCLQRINAMPGLKMQALEATYLAWIDARNVQIPNLHEKLIANGVRLMDGSLYLAEGYFRLNFACPMSVLKEALDRIELVMRAE